MMNLGKFYAVIARIFALNFALPPSAKLFSELNKNPKWIITNDSEANAKGRALYEESVKGESIEEIAKDFTNILTRSFFMRAIRRGSRAFIKNANLARI